MRVAIIARSTLYNVPGGDTVQAVQTALYLNKVGTNADIKLSNEDIDYSQYDLLHFFNIIRPADILYHIKKSLKPFVVSTILVNYREYDKYHRKGIWALLGYLSADGIEYLKTVARWLVKKDCLASPAYLWKGQRKSITEVLQQAAMVLPNSESEYQRLLHNYHYSAKYNVVTNGVDTDLFKYDINVSKDAQLILCVARIEGIKNQLNLIKALNNSEFQLLLIGSHSPNQRKYYEHCKSVAANNVTFINHLPQQELVRYYNRAKVHILPSWFETTGLSSIEAAAMGCNIVITDRGDAKEYFEHYAFYCDPEQPKTILTAVQKASKAIVNQNLIKKVTEKFTWANAAVQTMQAYQTAIT